MSLNLKDVDYLQVASLVNNISNDLKESIKKAFHPLPLISLTEFRGKIQHNINEIVCTPAKNGPSINEIHDFLNDELPLKLQKTKKSHHKELHRINSTIMSKSSNSTSITLANTTTAVATNDDCANITSYSRDSKEMLCNRNEIYKNYKNSMIKLDKLLNDGIISNKQTLQENNIALEKTKKFLKDLEKLGDLLKDENTRDAFTTSQEENIDKIGNDLSQFLFIQENKDLFQNLESTEKQNNEKLIILMNAVNDLLHEII